MVYCPHWSTRHHTERDMTTLSQLDRDWLDALAILGREIGRGEVLALNERWSPAVDGSANHQCIWLETWRDSVTETPDTRKVWIAQRSWETLPKIERVEILLYAACALDFGDGMEGGTFTFPREAFVMRCKKIGCHHTNTPDIQERWRLIDWSTPAHLLPLARFETRPVCQLCTSPVATGAGGYVADGKVTSWGDAESGGMTGRLTYRPDIHEECLRYAHRILAPALREARAAEQRIKARQAGEIDK